MKKILYLHGFGSSGSTKTADYLRTILPNTEVISPDIPIDPQIALRELNKLCHVVNPDVIVGTSMGAMYAQQMHGYHKVLVNPTFHVSEIMQQNKGINRFSSTREDGETEFTITGRLCDDYKIMEMYQFIGITTFDKAHTYAFFGMEDMLANDYDEYLKYYGNAIKYPGGHSLQQEYIKAYILPNIKQLLEEKEDTENINSKKTYELLSIISEGGKKGHQAYKDLWFSCYRDYYDIAHQFPELYAPMTTMRKGFKKAVYSFVCDFEEIPYISFSKHSYEEIEKLFEEESARKVYNKFVAKGRKMDPIHAMKLLTRMYIDNCGISLGERTLAYDAGSGWLKKYIDDNPEQTEWNDFTCFSEVMAAICVEYNAEEYDQYDIAPLTIEEERKDASSSAKTLDEDTAAALCWGIEYLGRSMHNDNHYLLKKVLIENDKHLDMTEQAIFYNLKDAEEEMQQWTEQNREHLLCYIIREIPWKKAFRDEPAYTFCCRPDEPYLEENDYKEYVYLPSGLKRKFHFKVGDMVEYIYHDVDVTAMKWGCIAKLPSKKDNSILILDSKRSVEGLSQKAYIDCCVKVPARYVFQLKKL
jgi:hypothetical protein